MCVCVCVCYDVVCGPLVFRNGDALTVYTVCSSHVKGNGDGDDGSCHEDTLPSAFFGSTFGGLYRAEGHEVSTKQTFFSICSHSARMIRVRFYSCPSSLV